MRSITIALPLAILILCRPSPARADSDGYYCTGRGYIAYETRFSEGSDRHLLHVVRLSSADGIGSPETIVLPEFQVHGMSCQPTVVEIEGWTDGYSVDISDPANPLVTTRPTALDPGLPAPIANLGHWSKAGVIDIEVDGSPGEFQLVIARVSRELEGGIEHYTFTQVLRREPGPDTARIVSSVKLFEGIFLETIDG